MPKYFQHVFLGLLTIFSWGSPSIFLGCSSIFPWDAFVVPDSVGVVSCLVPAKAEYEKEKGRWEASRVEWDVGRVHGLALPRGIWCITTGIFPVAMKYMIGAFFSVASILKHYAAEARGMRSHQLACMPPPPPHPPPHTHRHAYTHTHTLAFVFACDDVCVRMCWCMLWTG